MSIGIGYQNGEDAFLCGRNAAARALVDAGAQTPGLVLAFCHGGMDGERFVEGIRSVVGPTPPVVGGSAVGIITNDTISYEGCPAGVAVLGGHGLHCEVSSGGELNRGESVAGAKMAAGLAGEGDEKLLLIFYDSINRPATPDAPPIMNASPPLLQGIEETLTKAVPIIGAGVLGGHDFSTTLQFCGDHVARQSIVGCMLSGDLTPYYRIMHGCTLKDGVYHTITRTDGPIIYEMDGRPVVEVIDEIYGNREWQTQVPVKRLTIGVNFGEKYGRFEESNYLNRLIMGILPGGEGIVIFEPDFEAGTQVQFMLRDPDRMVESARENAAGLLAQVRSDGRKPVFGLYVDCAGRAASSSETLTEEAAEVQAVCNQYDVPLLGFYSGVEIAPLLGKSRGLDWTGVFMVLAEG